MTNIYAYTLGTVPSLESPDLPELEPCLTLTELMDALRADIAHAKAARIRAETDVLMPRLVLDNFYQREQRLRTAAQVIHQYLDAAEEAALYEADQPLPLFITALGLETAVQAISGTDRNEEVC